MARGIVRSPVHRLDADHRVLGSGLGKFDEDVEIAVFVEQPTVEKLEFRLAARAAAALLDQSPVRVFLLRILVEVLHVRVRRRRVDVEVVLLEILAVIGLGADEPEHALLQNRITTVPQGEREHEHLIAITPPGDAVLPPAVCLGARARTRTVPISPKAARAPSWARAAASVPG